MPAAAQNLAVNPDFDTDIDDWQLIGPITGPGGLDPAGWSSRDWNEPDRQGSLRLVNHGDADLHGSVTVGAVQCVELPPGTEMLRYRAWVDIPEGQSPATGGWVPELRFQDTADCFTGTMLSRVFLEARGLPENRPWVNQEGVFPVPSGTLGVEIRLGSTKLTGGANDPFVLYYDGIVLEPMFEPSELRTVIELRGEITSVNDAGGVVDDSIVPGVPLVAELVYDEAFGGDPDTDFQLQVPPGWAEFRLGNAVLRSSSGSAYLVEIQTGATDQISFRVFSFDPSPALAPLEAAVTLTDSTGSTFPDDPGVIDLALVDALTSSRTFNTFGVGFSITGTFSQVRVAPLRSDLAVFRAALAGCEAGGEETTDCREPPPRRAATGLGPIRGPYNP